MFIRRTEARTEPISGGSWDRLRRAWPFWPRLIAISLVLITAVTVGVSIRVASHYPTDPGIRWTAITGVGAIGGVALGLLAALVATEAYRRASQHPILSVSWTFGAEPVKSGGALDFDVSSVHEWPFELDRGDDQHLVMKRGRLILTNHGNVSARNLSVSIEPQNLLWDYRHWPCPDWPREIASLEGVRLISAHWARDRVVHGYGDQVTWDMELDGMWWRTNKAQLVVTVAADGFKPRKTEFPVRIRQI
jgi:hypothetical protein